MTTATRKLTAEEGKPNNRNNGWNYEMLRNRITGEINMNNKYTRTNWKTENNEQKTRKQKQGWGAVTTQPSPRSATSFPEQRLVIEPNCFLEKRKSFHFLFESILFHFEPTTPNYHWFFRGPMRKWPVCCALCRPFSILNKRSSNARSRTELPSFRVILFSFFLTCQPCFGTKELRDAPICWKYYFVFWPQTTSLLFLKAKFDENI